MPKVANSHRRGNGLALLANKCASRTFDISSGMVYASMRDQIVRAQLLVRDLQLKDPSCRKLLIVGAGVAGVAAASCAQQLGIEFLVLESNNGPLSLQTGVHKRMVGPFMYEWPNIVADAQHYPLGPHGLGSALNGTPTWISEDPLSADDFAKAFKTWLVAQNFSDPSTRFVYGVDPEETRAYVRQFVDAMGSDKDDQSQDSFSPPVLDFSCTAIPKGEPGPDYIILAVGMGTEQTRLVNNIAIEGVKFWADDDFRNTPEMSWPVGVFGGGDGALQDVLRLMTCHDHPLGFIRALEASCMAEDLAGIRSQLDSLEQQSRLLATWSNAPVYDLIDERCKVLCATLAAKPHVVQSVHSQLRDGRKTGSVMHVYSGQGFGKAYLLNRFCVHLIAACLVKGAPKKLVRYVPLSNRIAVRVARRSSKYEVELDNGKSLLLDRIAVRFGPTQDSLNEGQLIQLSGEQLADRVSMSAIPLPYVVAH